MSDELWIFLTGGLVATACGTIGPLLMLSRATLIVDAISHAILPGIVVGFLLFHTRAVFIMFTSALIFACLCILLIGGLRRTTLVRFDAAIGLVFPTFFALGVVGITRYTGNVHLDLDAAIFGEIAFTPFDVITVSGFAIPRATIIIAAVALLNILVVFIWWKEWKTTIFDPQFAKSSGLKERFLSWLLLFCAALTCVAAFEAVGAVLVVALFSTLSATGILLAHRLWSVIICTVSAGWVSAYFGQKAALQFDSSIAGMIGVTALLLLLVSMLVARIKRKPTL